MGSQYKLYYLWCTTLGAGTLASNQRGISWSSNVPTWANGDAACLALTAIPPDVSSVELTSDPNNNTYAIGDEIEATVTFSAAVDITGTPQLELDFAGTPKPAACAAATNTTTMVCSYTVAVNDSAPNGIAIAANKLTLNGGTIRATGSTTLNADLDHGAVAIDAGQKVDGTQVILTFSETIGSADRTKITIAIGGGNVAQTSAARAAGTKVELDLSTIIDATVMLTVALADGEVPQDPPKSLDEFRVGPQTQRQAMSPEALALAEKRIEMEMRDRTREFARTAADKHEEASMHGVGTSSMLILSIHALARTELDARARSALATAQRAFTADDAEPSDELRTEVIGLIDRAVRELSSDVDAVYEKHCSRMKGKWPTLEEPRQRALDLATSDLDVDLLARRLRQAGDLRGVGGSRSGLRHSHPGQQEAGVGDRRHLVSSAGEAQRKAPGALQELPLSGGELVQAATHCRQGRASSW